MSTLPQEFLPLIAGAPGLSLIGNTPLVPIVLPGIDKPGVEVYAKVEYFNPGGSIKDRPVLWMLLSAILDGRLTRERTVLDSSSGNAGIAYAMIGGALGYKVKLVMPENASEERKKRILAHGAQLDFTDAVEGYDEALREVRRQAEADPDKYFFCDQYSNESNWQAHYNMTAVEILEQTDRRVTHFVGGVGTGGTITGVGRRLKEELPEVEVTMILPDAFPGIEGLKPMETEDDIVPEIFDESVVDRISSRPTICARLWLARVFSSDNPPAVIFEESRMSWRGSTKGSSLPSSTISVSDISAPASGVEMPLPLFFSLYGRDFPPV